MMKIELFKCAVVIVNKIEYINKSILPSVLQFFVLHYAPCK